MGEFFCDCGAPLNENGECPYCDSPGLPFAINDPIWDRIYGNRLTPVAGDGAGTGTAEQLELLAAPLKSNG